MEDQQQPTDQTGSTARYPVNMEPSPEVTPQPPQAPGQQSWAQISHQDTPPKQPGKLRFIIIMAAAVIVIIVLVFFIHEATKPKDLTPSPDNSAGLAKPAANAASGVTPLGESAAGSADTADLSIKIERVISDPQTTGDRPDPGTKYVEIDLSVTNSGQGTQVVPGTFVYDAQDGRLFYTADSTGKGSGYANKNVQVSGKQSLDDLSLGPGQTDSSHYLIYQLPAKDTGGELIWYDGYYDTSSTKLAVFALP